MKIDLGTRVGIAGAILTLLSIAAFYLWPGVKAIGWLCLVAGICVLLIWAVLEIRSYGLISKLVLAIRRWPLYSVILVALLAFVLGSFGTYMIVGSKVPSLSVVTESPPAPEVPFAGNKKGKASGNSTRAAPSIKTVGHNHPAAQPATVRPSPARQITPHSSQRLSGRPELSAYSQVQKVAEEVNTKSRNWADGLDFCQAGYDQYVGMAGELSKSELQSIRKKALNRYVACVQAFLDRFRPVDQGAVEAAVEDAIKRMQMPGEKQITPNQASQLRQECEAALANAQAGPSLDDPKPDKADRSRFKPLADYLTKLLKRLGGYRENPR